MITDRQWLERFCAGDERAFTELVRRHAGWIYRLAVCRLGGNALAEDATQAVFLVLLRKAPSLSSSTPLAGWLHRTAMLVIKEIIRNDIRRKKREEAFAMMRQEPSAETENLWSEISPLLEPMLGRLSKADRQAVLLRYFAQRDFAEVAAEMGATESAARKRVERALQKLRHFFAAANIHTTSDLFGSALLLHAGGGAEGSFVLRIAAHSASPAIEAISNAVLRKLRWMKAGLIGSIAGIVGVAVVVTAVVRSSPLPNPAAMRPVDSASALPNPSATVPSDPELNRLIAQLQASETKIHNLRIIHFAVTQQRRSGTNSQWAPTLGQVEGSAWFDDAGGGRARYQFSKSIQEMFAGPRTTKKEWVSRSIDCGTDGRQTRYTMSSDKWIIWPRQEVEIGLNPCMDIFPGVDGILTSLEYPNNPWSFASGEVAIMFTKNSAHPEWHARVSEIILDELSKGEKFHVRHQTINAIPVVGIVADRSKPDDPPQEWWLDPQRGFTLVQSKDSYERGRADPRGRWRVNITKWKQAAPGIWFPIAATSEEDFTDYTDRFIYSVEDVAANDPKFNQADFLPPLAVGEPVTDHHSNPPREYNFSEDSGIP